MAEKQWYALPYLHMVVLGDTTQFVCTTPKGKVLIIYVHLTRQTEVKVDDKAGTISIEVERMADFKDVEFTKNLAMLRYSNPNPPARR